MEPHESVGVDPGLARLGWRNDRGRCEGLGLGPGEAIARVAAVDRGLLLLLGSAGAFRARLSGSYRYQHSRELPCVGDWVAVAGDPSVGSAQVTALLTRRTELRRRSAGDRVEHQMIAANIDTVIIVQSSHYDFNLKRLERYLVMVRAGGPDPWILLTKTDLVDPEELSAQIGQIRSAGITAPLFTLSNVTQEGVDRFMGQLVAGRTYCLVGSSGVGKSTLINRLLGREALQTREVSGTGEGRHTTVRRELMLLENGAMVIDSPGMREFGIVAAADAVSLGFSDIDAVGGRCRYRDCTHTSEPGCAVLEAVGAGEIDRRHYDNYLKLREESAFYEMTQAERRGKERAFGRFKKTAFKEMKDE